MAGLTTHVLDTAAGVPGAGVRIELYELRDGARNLINETETNSDGRTDSPLLDEDQIHPGEYEIVFHIGDYFSTAPSRNSAERFLDKVPVRFGIDDPRQHYHIPLLASPWSYSTYRGS